MQATVQQITQKLTDLLPENDQYYRLDELRRWGFPSFIVHRIKIELERNLAESMLIPKTDWANTQSDAVLDAWQQFVDAIRAEARLPASYGKTVIETAVADVVEMLVQPRKNIPEVIFGNADTLSRQEVRERLETVVVYRHFAKLIQRYMQRKEIDQLSKKRCRKIIKQADQKLTAQYSPLNWAQMLEPLFTLVNDEIDTNLLRLFFEDKSMPRIARQFDLMNNSVSRAEFIEALSSPDSLNINGDEEEQSHLFDDQPASRGGGKENAEGRKEPEGPPEDHGGQKYSLEEKDAISESATERETGKEPEDPSSDENMNGDFSPQAGPGLELESPEAGEGNSLNAIFSRQEDVEPGKELRKEEIDRKRKEAETAVDTKPDTGKEAVQVPGEKEAEKEKAEDKPRENRVEENKQEPLDKEEKADSAEEETPMWMRYMSEEEIEEYKKQQESEADEEEDGFIEEPIVDLTSEEATENEIAQLKSQLETDRALFVEEIFGGSERAFDEAVEEIAAYDSWRDVSKFIEKEVFKRNLVDMYSEAAVDFTDQLQSYFLDKQS